MFKSLKVKFLDFLVDVVPSLAYFFCMPHYILMVLEIC